jgi:hypothetical protein
MPSLTGFQTLTQSSILYMWCKKSLEEMNSEKLVRRGKDRRAAFIFWILAVAFIVITPPTHYYRPIWGGMHLRGLGGLPRWIVPPLLAGGVAGWWLLSRYRDESRVTSLVCPKCGMVKGPDGNVECKCGGKFVDIRTVKWVGD